MRVGAHSDHYCVLGARTGTERRSGMGRAGDGTCVSRGVCGFRDLRTVRWPAVGAVAPGWDAAGSGEGAAERVFRALARRPGDGGDRVVAVAQPLGGQVHPPAGEVRGRGVANCRRKRRASVARETPVAAASGSTVHERDLRTNYLGPPRVIRAFVPALEHNAPAAVVNALVLVALEPMGPAFLDYGRGDNRPEVPIGTQKPSSVRDKEDFCPNGRWHYPVIRVRARERARPAGPSDPA